MILTLAHVLIVWMHINDWFTIFVMTSVWWIVNEIKTSSSKPFVGIGIGRKENEIYRLSLNNKKYLPDFIEYRKRRRVLSYSLYSRTVKYFYAVIDTWVHQFGWIEGEQFKDILYIWHYFHNWIRTQLSKSQFEMEYRISKLRLNKKNRQPIACGDYRHNLRVGMKFQNSRGEVSLKVFVNVEKS